MGQPVHRFLEEFGGDEGHSPAIVRRLLPKFAERPAGPNQFAIELEAAYTRGREDGEAAVRTAAQAEIAELRADCQRWIETTKNTFAEQVADRLALDLQTGLAHAASAISAHVATILLPLLRDRLAEAAVTAFAAQLRAIVDGSDAITITLSGPDELVRHILPRLEAEGTWRRPGGAPQIHCVAGDGTELRVVFDQTVIESRLVEWLGRIEEATR